MSLVDLSFIVGGSILGASSAIASEIFHSYREKHPKEPKAVLIDIRSDFEKFMNTFGYDRHEGYTFDFEVKKHVKYCPFPNPNPNNILGRFATKDGYFKGKKESKV